MIQIAIYFRDGFPARTFNHRGRSGGSYSISIRYEGGMAIVTDEYGATEAFPLDRIAKVETQPFLR
jgi:hypothetical protein